VAGGKQEKNLPATEHRNFFEDWPEDAGFSYHPPPTSYHPSQILMGITRFAICIYSKFMVKPNGLLVTVSSTYYYAYTSVLSTW
jgi:hypothetical protein